VQAAFFMLIAHAGMKGLAFLCKGIYHFTYNVSTIEKLRGIAWSLPMTALCFALALAGLGGIPPLAGFTGKWLMLTEVLASADIWTSIGLIVFLINTLIGLGYYLPLIFSLFSPIHEDFETPVQLSNWLRIPVFTLSALIIVMGLLPNPWLSLTSRTGPFLLSIGK
jgi:NADH:ubiquinone oxidoreductase subunit 2 (subunit N)